MAQSRVRRMAPGGGTEERPAQVGLDQPREVVVQEVTRESGHALAKSMGYQRPAFCKASQELKSQPKNALIVSVMSSSSFCASGGVEVAVHPVTVVQRRCGIVVDDARLRPETDAAHESVEAGMTPPAGA